MFNQVTYNVLIERFKAFAAGHYKIERFSHGQIDVTDIDKEQKFPWMHVVPVSMQPSSGSRSFTLDVVFADMPRDIENKTEYQRESLSDCMQLAEDLLAEIKNGSVIFGEDVTLEEGSAVQPFMEEYTHVLTGVTLSLTLTFPWNWNACDIPADWTTGGSSSGGGGGFVPALVLKVNNVDNINQNILNLVNGTNVTIEDLGDGRVRINSVGGITSVAWGDIVGNIADQLDLAIWFNEKADVSSLAEVAFTGDYNDLTNTPIIPDAQQPSDWNATTGVTRILNKPTIPSAQVNSNWNASSGVAQILNKPTLATVATSGSYTDLTNKPTIPAAQIQSDWNQSNNAALDYIKNKPTIGTGSVTSVGLSMPAPTNKAFTVSNSPVTNAGTLQVTANGTSLQYIDGTGALKTFPAVPKTLADLIGNGTNAGDIIQWNGSTWVITIPSWSLEKLSDVNVAGVTAGQVLTWDDINGEWIPTTPSFTQVNADWNATSGVAKILNKPTIPELNWGNIAGDITHQTDLWNEIQAKANSSDLSLVAFSGDYNDLNNQPTIPTATSELTNDSGFITIGDVPTQVQSNWTQTDNSQVDFIKNKPTIPTTLPPSGAASGDLQGNYPSPTVHRIHGVDMQSGTPTTDDTWVYGGSPAKWQHQKLHSNQVTNDSNVTGTNVDNALNTLNSGKQDTLVSGTNIKTINATTILGTGNINTGTVTSVAALTLDTNGTDLSSTVATGSTTPIITLSVPTASATSRGVLSAANWSTFNGKQNNIGLTTVGNNIATIPNPSAISYLRINADNSISALTVAQLKTDLSISSNLTVVLGSNVTNVSNVAYEDITGLSFAVAANKTYRFRANLQFVKSAGTGMFSINGPTAATNGINYRVIQPATFTSLAFSGQIAYNTGSATNLAAGGFVSVDGIVKVTASGTVIMRFVCNTSAALTILAGSFIEYSEIA